MAIGGRPAIGEHSFLNAFINESATITENVAVDIEEPAHKAVAYDPDGKIVLAESGETARERYPGRVGPSLGGTYL